MRIPVVVSDPTQLNPSQKKLRQVVIAILDDLQLEPRPLGRSDYPKDVLLKEVVRDCPALSRGSYLRLRAVSSNFWCLESADQGRGKGHAYETSIFSYPVESTGGWDLIWLENAPLNLPRNRGLWRCLRHWDNGDLRAQDAAA